MFDFNHWESFMFRKYGKALLATAALASSAGVVNAADVYEGGVAFQPAIGANEAVVSRVAGFGTSYITTGGTSDIQVVATPARNAPVPSTSNQTVTIVGATNAGGTAASCAVHSVSPSGSIAITKSASQVVGATWTLNLTFTPAQAPAGNTFVAVCTLQASNANRIFSVSVSP
jgi:hypothetical protein